MLGKSGTKSKTFMLLQPVSFCQHVCQGRPAHVCTISKKHLWRFLYLFLWFLPNYIKRTGIDHQLDNAKTSQQFRSNATSIQHDLLNPFLATDSHLAYKNRKWLFENSAPSSNSCLLVERKLIKMARHTVTGRHLSRTVEVEPKRADLKLGSKKFFVFFHLVFCWLYFWSLWLFERRKCFATEDTTSFPRLWRPQNASMICFGFMPKALFDKWIRQASLWHSIILGVSRPGR